MMKRYQEALTAYEQVLSIDKNNINVVKFVGVLKKYQTTSKNLMSKFSLIKIRVVKKELLIKSLKKVQIIFALLLLSIIGYLTYSGYDTKNNIEELVRTVEVSRLSKNFEKALSRTDEILLLFPNSDVGYRLKVDILFELDKYEEAIVSIDKLMTDNPNDVGLYMLKGIAFGESGRKPEAIEYLNTYLSTYPDDDFIVMYRDKLQKSTDNISSNN